MGRYDRRKPPNKRHNPGTIIRLNQQSHAPIHLPSLSIINNQQSNLSKLRPISRNHVSITSTYNLPQTNLINAQREIEQGQRDNEDYGHENEELLCNLVY